MNNKDFLKNQSDEYFVGEMLSEIYLINLDVDVEQTIALCQFAIKIGNGGVVGIRYVEDLINDWEREHSPKNWGLLDAK